MIRIGFAPGAFDIFHVGHLNLLRRALQNIDDMASRTLGAADKLERPRAA